MVFVTRSSGLRSSVGFLMPSNLSALAKPVFKICNVLVKDGEALVKVENEDQTVVRLLENLHPSLDLAHLVGHWLLLLVRQHLLEAIVGSRDCVEETFDSFPEVGGSLHPHLIVGWSSLQVEDLLDVLKLSVSQVELLVSLNLFVFKGLPRSQIVSEGLLSRLSFLICVIPSLSKLLDVPVQELWTIGILHKLLSLGNEVHDHLPLVLQGVEHLVLLLDVLLRLLAVPTNQLLDGSVPQVVDELEDGDEVVTI